MHRFIAIVAVVVLAVVIAPRAASAQTWPTDDQWRILYCGGVPSFDPVADEAGASNERDVVGDSEHPALYYFADATHFFLRMRVDASPTQADGFRPFGWGVEFDTDADRTTYELLSQVDGISNPDVVSLSANTTQARLDDPADPVETTLTTYPTTTHARGVPAEGPFASQFGGSPDFFVDWAIERADLAAQGVTDATALVIVMGTSNNTQALNADLACWDDTGGVGTLSGVSTDPFTPAGTAVPDMDGDGLYDAEEPGIGTNPGVADTDGDGFTDGVEVREGTDPLDPNSFPQDLGIRGGGGVGGCGIAGDGSSASNAWIALVLIAGAVPLARRARRRRAP